MCLAISAPVYNSPLARDDQPGFVPGEMPTLCAVRNNLKHHEVKGHKWRRVLVALVAMLLTWPVYSDVLEVSIEGLEEPALANAKKYLSIWRDRKRDDLDARRIRILHNKATQQLRAALEAYGYFDADISARLSREETAWRAVYAVKPGEVVTLRRVDIRVAGGAAVTEALDAMVRHHGFATGAPLDQGAYDVYKNKLLSAANNQGYLDATFSEHRIQLSRQPYYADITLVFEPGARYHFGDVSFLQTGEQRYDEHLLSRFLNFGPGDYYQPRRIIALHSLLLDSRYFALVEVTARRDRALDHRVPIEVVTTADFSRHYRFGGGFGTDTGPRISGRHERVVNPSGHKFNAEARYSPRNQFGNVTYAVPLRDPLTESLAFSVDMAQNDTDSRESRTATAGVHRIHIRNKWTETLGLKTELEDFEVADEHGKSTLVMPYASWQRVVADDRLFPRRGWRMGLELMLASAALGSDVDFVRAAWSAKWLRALGSHGRLLLRGQVGGTWTQRFNELPASKRFFAGGDQSIRGYAYEELGATNRHGRVRGGRYLLESSVEYEHRINEGWSGAVFFDAGNAFDGFSDPLKRGLGLGLRFRTPVGPVRLDLARGLDDPDSSFRIHLVLGPDL